MLKLTKVVAALFFTILAAEFNCKSADDVISSKYKEIRNRSIGILSDELNHDVRALLIFEIFRECIKPRTTLPIKRDKDDAKVYVDKFKNEWLRKIHFETSGILRSDQSSSEFLIYVILGDREIDRAYFIRVSFSKVLTKEELKNYLSLDIDIDLSPIEVTELLLYHRSGFFETYSLNNSYFMIYDAKNIRVHEKSLLNK